jgi:hypothetical protein
MELSSSWEAASSAELPTILRTERGTEPLNITQTVTIVPTLAPLTPT